MQAITHFVTRQSGFLAFLLLLFAVANGWYVCEGLWQGGGLHGYTDNMNNKYGFFIVWTWDAFMRMLVFFGLAVVFGLIALWRSGMIGLASEKARDMKSLGKSNGLQTKRKRAKRH